MNLPWLRYIGWARVALAAAALAASFTLPVSNAALIRGVIGFVLLYSVLLAAPMKPPRGILGLLAVIADTAFFLFLASVGSERLMWVAALVFLYLLAESLVFHTPVEVVAITGVSAIFCGVLPFETLRALEPTVVVAGLLACGFAISQQQQKRSSEELNLRIIEAQKGTENALDGERQRIASDFHDGPLQSFIALQMRLEILKKVIERDYNAGMKDLVELQGVAQSQVRDLRTFLHSMRPVDVDGANFISAARRMAESFQKESGLPVTFLGSDKPVGLPPETTTEALQMLRESLVNVQKHAGATRVAVSLENTERGLEISVEDNGHGFPFAGSYTLEELELLRLGPASLKRRARSLNADLLLESRPGRGAGLKVRIPAQ